MGGALALFVTKTVHLFEGLRVLVVGAGLGFAGLVIAVCTGAACVQLTDGDPEVVKSLCKSVHLNKQRFGGTEVTVRKVLWDASYEWSEGASFDIAVGADVVYLDKGHASLVRMLAHVLRPGC